MEGICQVGRGRVRDRTGRRRGRSTSSVGWGGVGRSEGGGVRNERIGRRRSGDRGRIGRARGRGTGVRGRSVGGILCQGRRSYWSTKRSVNVVGGMGFDVLRVDGYATNEYEDEEVVVEEQLAVHEGEEDVGKTISGRNM